MPAIYLDAHATTPVDPRVLEEMLPYFTEHFGNAASRNHPFGWTAAKAVERAREQVASLVGARFREVVFTSGATESNNLAIKGVAARAPTGRRHIVTIATEHRAVIDPCRALERDGFRVTYLSVDADGCLDVDELRHAVGTDTLLVSAMSANNEIGVLHPIREITEAAHAAGALVHCDAVQSVFAGDMQVDSGVDLLSLSAHKLYGPKGVGALFFAKRRPRLEMSPLFDGGGHERGIRSGTLNVPAIVGFGKAADLCVHEGRADAARIGALRDRLWRAISSALGGVHLNGPEEPRLPNNLNVRVDGVHGESLMKAIASEVAVSSGAACATASAEPSHVLRAIGLSDEQARASIRFGLSRFNTADDVDRAAGIVADAIRQLRQR